MLRQNEAGVLSGSEFFFNTIDSHISNLFYYTSLCGHYYCDDQYIIDRQYYDSLLLILVEKGSMQFSYHEKEFSAGEGDMVLIDCADPQRYTADPYAEFYWMHFAGANSLELCSHLTRVHGSPLFHMPNTKNAAIQIRALLRQFTTEQIISDAEQSRLIYSALCYLMPGNRDTGSLSEHTPTQQAVQYIHNHLSGDLSLKRLAAEVHLSPSHLIRLFRAERHYSPHEYVIRCRMDRAKYLLKTTDLPIKAIAAEVGYGTETSFTGAFTEKIGISPRKFRDMPLG
ncbi:MAG: AraC family transcriptional regulator [Butyricicoccus porcorum]|nr:AraC family transcriptional regulator [Butyricicoccus porcorum]MDD6987497.1 AraC family transcriptional regulator [Butyricicoccus porcorum]MDY4482841.1 AraC family transcriptional regulator [Butyricicoccus porcorum]